MSSILHTQPIDDYFDTYTSELFASLNSEHMHKYLKTNSKILKSSTIRLCILVNYNYPVYKIGLKNHEALKRINNI